MSSTVSFQLFAVFVSISIYILWISETFAFVHQTYSLAAFSWAHSISHSLPIGAASPNKSRPTGHATEAARWPARAQCPRARW